MADIVDFGGGLDVTKGVRTGLEVLRTRENIRSSQTQDVRAQETFDINKRQAEQTLSIQKQQEVDRQLNSEIDKVQGMWETAHKVGNQRAKDELRQRLTELTGVHITSDDEELGNLLADRRAAVKAKDQEAVDNIDNYLLEVRSLSPEQAATAAGIESEVAQLGAEREFETKLGQEQRQFDIKKERTEQEQAEVRETTAKAIEGVEGLDDTMKSLIPLISSGEISGGVLNVIAAEKGMTVQRGIAGSGENEGKSVAAFFDKSGKKVFEFPETPKVEKDTFFISTTDIYGNTTKRPVVQTEDANGNPIFTYAKIQEPEGATVVAKTGDVVIKAELEKVEGAEILPLDTFLEDFEKENPGVLARELTSEETQDIINLYKQSIENIRKEKEEPGFLSKLFGGKGKGEEEETEKSKKATSRILKKLGLTDRTIPKKEKKKETLAETVRRRAKEDKERAVKRKEFEDRRKNKGK